MTPKPPSSSEGSSLPPRSRPNLGDLLKDSSESDLWALDDLDSGETPSETPKAKPLTSIVPEPREASQKKPPVAKGAIPEKASENDKSFRVDVRKDRLMSQSGTSLSPSVSDDDFDELDHWEEPEAEMPVLEIHPSFLSGATEETESDPVETTPPVEAPAAVEQDEFSPAVRENASSASLVPHLMLSKLERIVLWVLLAVLIIGGGAFFMTYIHRLPTESHRVESGDFPVKGQHVTILSADTYWRPPITEGENADTFRRGTELLPVVSLTASGGPAAVRLFFRNQDGEVMGDSVTREIQSGASIQVAATAGFEDIGMHAAYRTGQSKPWIIQVFEAPSVTSDIPEFKKLFEIDISTDRR